MVRDPSFVNATIKSFEVALAQGGSVLKDLITHLITTVLVEPSPIHGVCKKECKTTTK